MSADFTARNRGRDELGSVSPTPGTKRRRKGWFIGLFIAILIALIGSSLGILLLSRHQSQNSSPENQILGHAFFVSSGQLSESSSQGDNDELQIEMKNVPDPAPGSSYYAWLLSDKNQRPTTAMFLGTLSIEHGAIHFRYPGDQQHSNLIATTSRLLITEESKNSVHRQPSSDQRTWRYYAELPQDSSTGGAQHPTALSCLRSLLYEGADLHQLGIHGSPNIRLLRNTGKILEWIYSARDNSKDPAFVRRQITRTLDYLDGTSVLVNPLLAQIPLIDLAPNQAHRSYPALIYAQLTCLMSSPGLTADVHGLALQSKQALMGNVKPLFMQLHQMAKQLVLMTDEQLLQPSTLSLLDNMVALANVAFVGRLDPSTNEVQPGVVQIFYNIQRLATYTILAIIHN